MLYLSLILIVSGIFFIIFTVASITKKETDKSDTDKETNRTKPPFFSKERILRSEKTSEEAAPITNNKNEDKNTSLEQHKIINQDNPFGEERSEAEIPFSDEAMSYDTPVVLYEDSSSIINYNNNDSIIDSTLEEYKKIKRIGPGNIEILNDGINFRAGKKLYRFDFRRIANIKSGNNFIVLFIKGSNVLRLFLFKKDAALLVKLKQLFKNNLTNVL
ncbi:MAG: hypothetical protein V1874_15730 [Spirochaetota bacterium]